MPRLWLGKSISASLQLYTLIFLPADYTLLSLFLFAQDWNLLLPPTSCTASPKTVHHLLLEKGKHHYITSLCPSRLYCMLLVLWFLFQISLSMNCQPPKHTGRAAQIQTVFIALLFFPSFVGALSMVAFTVWRCDPFIWYFQFGSINGFLTKLHFYSATFCEHSI